MLASDDGAAPATPLGTCNFHRGTMYCLTAQELCKSRLGIRVANDMDMSIYAQTDVRLVLLRYEGSRDSQFLSLYEPLIRVHYLR